MNKKILIILPLLIIIGCKRAPLTIYSKIYSPDSTHIIVSYYHDEGAFGRSKDQTSIINTGDKIPPTGNLIENEYPPLMKWISNDTILVFCGTDVKSTRKWAKLKIDNIILIYKNTNPSFQISKKVFFSNYYLKNDSSITFQTGIKQFLYYLEWDKKYTFPIRSLAFIKTGKNNNLITIKDSLIFNKTVEITKGRYINVKYIPDYDIIPSNINDKKLYKLKSIIKKRI